MRIIFAGTPDFAAAQLESLLQQDIRPVAVYSQPDRPKGRGKKLIQTPVKQIAEAHDIPVFQPQNFKSAESLQQLADLKPDLMIVVAYGLILPQAVLQLPKFGCINVHASILPRWRGAAPVERAIAAGDQETGVTIMQMDQGLDTGDMLHIQRCTIEQSTTGDVLRQQLQGIGSEALIHVLQQLEKGQLEPIKQDHGQANYAEKLTKQEAAVNWSYSAQRLLKTIHAFNSANTCYAAWQDDRVKIFTVDVLPPAEIRQPGEIVSITKQHLTVACGDGSERLALLEIQLPNAKRMATAAVLNGRRDYFAVGQAFA